MTLQLMLYNCTSENTEHKEGCVDAVIIHVLEARPFTST